MLNDKIENQISEKNSIKTQCWMMKLEKIKTKKGQAHWHGPLKKPMFFF